MEEGEEWEVECELGGSVVGEGMVRLVKMGERIVGLGYQLRSQRGICWTSWIEKVLTKQRG